MQSILYGELTRLLLFSVLSRNRGFASRKPSGLVKQVLTTGVLIWLIFHYAGSSMKDKIPGLIQLCVKNYVPGTFHVIQFD